MQLLQLTLKETNATLPGSAPPKKGGAAQLLARLAFLPLLAGALTLAVSPAVAGYMCALMVHGALAPMHAGALCTIYHPHSPILVLSLPRSLRVRWRAQWAQGCSAWRRCWTGTLSPQRQALASATPGSAPRW